MARQTLATPPFIQLVGLRLAMWAVLGDGDCFRKPCCRREVRVAQVMRQYVPLAWRQLLELLRQLHKSLHTHDPPPDYEPSFRFWTVTARHSDRAFFGALVPSGSTLTEMLSNDSASILIRTNLSMLQALEEPVQHTSPRPSAHMPADSVPSAKAHGRPRHLQPCAETSRMGLRTCRFERLTFPRWRGRQSSIRQYWASVSSKPEA